MEEKELQGILEAEIRGIEAGIRLMKNRMLLACENGTPIEIDGRAYFIHNDSQNLQRIFANIEAEAD